MSTNIKANDQEVSNPSVKHASIKYENENDRIGNDSGNDKENTPNNFVVKNYIVDGGESVVHCTNKASTATTTTTTAGAGAADEIRSVVLSRPRDAVSKEISKQVLRHKLQKLRHLVLKGVISEDYLDNEIFHPRLLDLFDPQTVVYNGGVANVKEWKISCYLEVMEGGVPCTNPNLELRDVFLPLLETCDDLFLLWYKQQHSCNRPRRSSNSNNNNVNSNSKTTPPPKTTRKCKRLMTFVTRYTPAPGEQALLKHIDGAGKVDGSCVVALPTDRWSAPEAVNSWHGHGGGLTFWDGREEVPEDSENLRQPQRSGSGSNESQQQQQSARIIRRKPRFRPKEIHYQTRSGDVAFIDRAVWHQADPITKGTRWALVIFYKVTEDDDDDGVLPNKERKEKSEVDPSIHP